MATETRIVSITAARTYIGQHTIEIPSFCRNDRFRGIVIHGGSTARYLANRMIFGRVQGTGLARPVVSDSQVQTPDFPLDEIRQLLREDGFIF